MCTIPPASVIDEDAFDEIASAGRTALYRLYDAADELLYIGISDDLAGRMSDHARKQPWWSEVARKTVVWYAFRIQAETAETIAIGLEQPRHNKAKRYVRLPERSFDDVVTLRERQLFGLSTGEGSPPLDGGQPARGAQGVEADAGRWGAVLKLPAGLNGSLLRMCVQALADGDGSLPGEPNVLLPHDFKAFCELAKRAGIARCHKYKLYQKWMAAHSE